MGRILMVSLGFVLLVTLTSWGVEAQATRENPHFIWPVWDIPNPHSLDVEERRLCRRENISSVCDPNGLIRPYQADALDSLITNVYRNTTCQCMDCRINNHGYIIRLVILPRMQLIYNDRANTSTTRLRDAMMYSYILSRRWNMEGSCNETALILFSKHDDILFTLTRSAARMRLTDNDVTRVSLAVRHYFDEDDTIADGLMEMIRRYRLIFQGRHGEAFLPTGSRGRRET